MTLLKHQRFATMKFIKQVLKLEMLDAGYNKVHRVNNKTVVFNKVSEPNIETLDVGYSKVYRANTEHSYIEINSTQLVNTSKYERLYYLYLV